MPDVVAIVAAGRQPKGLDSPSHACDRTHVAIEAYERSRFCLLVYVGQTRLTLASSLFAINIWDLI
ncbi:hypothetical protein VK92_15520 [Burkholderia sp. LK4]|nr:hypothetical protein VL00_05890 [Burkholderia cepacia]KMN59583.1 hypothetical protein VK92_15520 [Burkholderia sp. LK4]